MDNFDAVKFISLQGGQWNIYNGFAESGNWLVDNSDYPWNGRGDTFTAAVIDFKTKNEKWMAECPNGIHFGNPVKPFRYEQLSRKI